jgi:hypothetical protein
MTQRLVWRTVQTVTVIFAFIGFTLSVGYTAMRLGLTKTSGKLDEQTSKFLDKTTLHGESYEHFPLAHTNEWIAFRLAVAKDKAMIEKVSKETGVPSRLLISLLAPEQMRLYHSDRPLFKSVFAPLKILGSQSQFSWGIFGIKDETARATEAHLLDETSPFYLGKDFEESLAFKTADTDKERFTRITDEHDHLYGYRYAAIYIKQIESQWAKAGHPITTRPEIIATLWNLGFEKSKPNNNPKSGGAVLTINDKEYSFGELARAFYYSDEMIEVFPVK